MVLGKKVAIFDWEWGQNLPPRDGQNNPLQADPIFTACTVSFSCACSYENNRSESVLNFNMYSLLFPLADVPGRPRR